MVTFVVPDMTCGHCVKTITQAVRQAAPDATLEFDLPAHYVKAAPDALADKVEAAIHAAGYAPKRI